MTISRSNLFPGFSDTRLMNDWLDAVNILATSQEQEPHKHIMSHIPFVALYDIKAMSILDETTWADMKAKMFKACIGMHTVPVMLREIDLMFGTDTRRKATL